MKIGITGGIGSGKSFVCRLLSKYGIQVYDCDQAAKRLMRTSPLLKEQLTQLIGPEAYDTSGQLNKAAIAHYLLDSQEHTLAINAIVHPAVFRDFEESGLNWMESAILFESGINRLVDRVIVVTAPEQVRISRIIQRDGITPEKAKEWISCQWPQEEVRKRADYEIVNDGLTDLNQQIENIINSL